MFFILDMKLSSTLLKFCFLNVLLFVIRFSGVSQESLNSGGTDVSNNNGSISYSFGQTFYLQSDSNTGSQNDGVQQPAEFFSVSIQEFITSPLFSFGPNPMNDNLTLNSRIEKGDYTHYTISDVLGRVFITESFFSSNQVIDVKNLTPNMYLLNIYLNEELKESFKLIKN